MLIFKVLPNIYICYHKSLTFVKIDQKFSLKKILTYFLLVTILASTQIMYAQNESSDKEINILLKNADEILYTYPDSAIFLTERVASKLDTLKQLNLLSKAYTTLGTSWYMKGEYAKSLSYYFKGLKIDEKLNNNTSIAIDLNNIGNIYLAANDSEKAINYFSKALEIKTRLNDQAGIGHTLINMANAFYLTGELEKALSLANKAKLIYNILKDNEKLILVYSTIGSIHKSRGEQEDALKFFNIAIASAEKIEDFQSLCVLQINSGNIYADIGETTVAIEIYENAMINAQEIDYREGMKDAFEKLYIIYEVEDDLESAYMYYQLFINVRDALQKRENVEALVTTEMEYKFDKERVKIQLEQEKNELLTAEKDKRQNLIILAIIVLLLGALIIVFLIYKSNKEKQKANEQLVNQNLIIEKKQTELLGSIDHAKRIQKKLEKSLIKEKELGQLKASFVTVASHQFRTPLSVIQSNTELLKILLNTGKKIEPAKYAKVNNRITSAISKMTALMDDVLTLGKLTSEKVRYTPEELDLVGFCKKMCEEFNSVQMDGRSLNVVTEGEAYKLQLDGKLLGHTLSNLISNAFKYSIGKASPELSIHFKSKELVLSVKDFGMGIPKEEQLHLFEPFFRADNVTEIQGTGLGLSIAKEYVEVNKGTISAKSILGEGSCFEIIFKKD